MSQPIRCPGPECAKRLPSARSHCPYCGTDLRPLVALRDLANTHFNDAVLAARSGHWHRAAEHVAVTLALAPDDVEATVLLAKISGRQHRRERAAQLWETALELAPDRADIQAGLAESRRPVAPWQRILDLAPSRAQIAAAVPSRDEITDLLRSTTWPAPRHRMPVERSGDG